MKAPTLPPPSNISINIILLTHESACSHHVLLCDVKVDDSTVR